MNENLLSCKLLHFLQEGWTVEVHVARARDVPFRELLLRAHVYDDDAVPGLEERLRFRGRHVFRRALAARSCFLKRLGLEGFRLGRGNRGPEGDRVYEKNGRGKGGRKPREDRVHVNCARVGCGF